MPSSGRVGGVWTGGGMCGGVWAGQGGSSLPAGLSVEVWAGSCRGSHAACAGLGGGGVRGGLQAPEKDGGQKGEVKGGLLGLAAGLAG